MTAKSRMTEKAKNRIRRTLSKIISTCEQTDIGWDSTETKDWKAITKRCNWHEFDHFDNWNDENANAYQEMVLESMTKLPAMHMAPIISFFELASEALQVSSARNWNLKDNLKDHYEIVKKVSKLQTIVNNHNINTELPEEDLTERGQEDGRIEAGETDDLIELSEWDEKEKLNKFNESLKSEPKRTYGDYQHLLEEHTKLKYKLIRLSVLLDEQLPHLETVQTEMEEMRNDLNILTQANRCVDKQSSAT